MPDKPTTNSKTGTAKKLLIALAVAVLLAVSFLGAFIFFLPRFVSSEIFKTVIENRASSILNRRLQIETIKWEWTDDISIHHITLADDPAFSNRPMVVAGRTRIKIFFDEILTGRLHFDFFLDNIQAGLIRNKNGQTNVGVLLAQIEQTQPAENQKMPMDLKNISFAVPFDVQSRVHVNKISINMEDRRQDKQLAFKNAAVRFDLPSLYLEPITLKASTDITIAGNKISSARLNVLIKDLFDDQGKLKLTDAYIDVAGMCPGAEFVLNADLNKFTVNSRLGFDLFKFSKIIEPFMPLQILPATIMGNLNIILHGNSNSQRSLSFDSTVAGKDIILSSGIWGGKTLGPLSFNVGNSGGFDPVKGSLCIKNGTLALLEKSTLAWSGTIKDLYAAAPAADFKFSTIRLHVGELFEKFKEFMPKGINFVENKQKKSSVIEINNATFSGSLPSGPNDMNVNSLVFKMPEVHYSPAAFQGVVLSADNARVSVKDFRTELKALFPVRMSLTAALTADSVTLKGEKEIHVKGLTIPDFTVVSDEIRRSENPLMGLTARFNVREKLSADDISIPPSIVIRNFTQTLDAQVALPSDANAEITVKNLKLQLPSLLFGNFDNNPFKTNAGLECRIGNISLLGTEPLDAGIKGFKAGLRVDDIVVADFEVDAEHTAAGHFNAGGSVLIYMAPLSVKFISKVFDKLKLTGETTIAWNIAGRLPYDSEIDKLASGVIDVKDDLDFVDKIDIDCRSKGMGLDLVVTKSNRLQIASVSTGAPARYSFDHKSGHGQIQADMMLQGIQLPHHLFAGKQFGAKIHVFGSHDYLDSVTFSQVVDLQPSNIKQTFDVSLRGLERIFKRNPKMPLPLWLNYVAGTVRGTTNISEETDLTAFIDNLKVKGSLASGAKVQLVPGEDVRLEGWTTSSDLDLQLGKMLGVKALKTNVHLKKDYRIIGKQKTAADESEVNLLSAGVLKAAAQPVAGPAFESALKDAVVTRRIGELQNRFSAQPAVAFKSAYMRVGSLPLSVDQAMIGFDLLKGLPNSDYFQLELLGGTVIGSAHVLQNKDAFYLQMQLAFSGLKAEKLYPLAGASDGDDSELSGRLWVSVPLSYQIDSVLRDLQVDLKLSRIGSKSFERFLYALDPSESNEAIVTQRRLLRTGFPRRVNINIKDGNLSLDGVVDVKGVSVAIPPLQRLNIANIGGLDKYARYLDRLMPVIDVLKVCSAGGIKISEDGRSLKFQTPK